MNNFKDFISEYKTVKDPNKIEKAKNWDIAIGLQAVDGLTPSEYLLKNARENIEGKVSHEQLRERLHKYYQTEDGIKQGVDVKEADLVSDRISELLDNPSFTFSPNTLLSIHQYLFQDALPPEWVGQIRTKDITKSEDILNGDTVNYGWRTDIKKALDYDFDREKAFDYLKITKREQIEHIAKFISGIWQIHPFREGNTRTVAVFTIKYLRNKRFTADNELFKEHSEYFRNALVRANYENLERRIPRTTKYLDMFFGNLLLGEKNILDNSDLNIDIANYDDKISDIISDKLSKPELEFLKNIRIYLENNGEIDSSKAQELTGKSPQRVRQLFTALVAADILIATGTNKGRKYKLNKVAK